MGGISSASLIGGNITLSNNKYIVGNSSLRCISDKKSFLNIPSSFTSNNGFTFSCNLFINQTVSNNIIYIFNNNFISFFFYSLTPTSGYFNLYCAAQNIITTTTNYLGNWYNFIIIMNTQNTGYVYMNNVLIGQNTSMTYSNSFTTFTSLLSNLTGYNNNDIYIDDFFLYDRVLTPYEMTYLYNRRGKYTLINK
jgi:hypothetical protein